MWNPFKKNNKQLKELQALSSTFAILEEFERRGVIHWQTKQKCLLIEEFLATLKLAEGAEGFKHFLEQVAQWQNFKLLQESYEAHRINIEAKAVRDAKKQHANLTNADIQRIRQNARANMAELDLANIPTFLTAGGGSAFDIFIIRATAPSAADATEANGQLLALGHYDGKTLEMAMYDDIKHNLQNNE